MMCQNPMQGKARMLAGFPSGYMPLAAVPGRLAFMNLDEHEIERYFAKHPRHYEVRRIKDHIHE